MFVCFENNAYLCGDFGEKSGAADALAYYFALNQKCLRNSFWNIHEIIEVRLPEQSGSLPTVLKAMLTPPWRGIFLLHDRQGFHFLRHAPRLSA